MFKYIKNQIINLVNKNQNHPKEFGEYFNNAYHTPKDIHKDIIKNIQYWLNEEEARCKQVKFNRYMVQMEKYLMTAYLK